MSIRETLPRPLDQYFKYHMHKSNSTKDTQAMVLMEDLVDCMARCKGPGLAYAHGSWGYTVLRTAYSAESDALWPIALEKLKRWVAQYFVHLNRLMTNKSDSMVNEELGRRFILEVVDATDSEVLKNFTDPSGASQDDIKSLTGVFESWRDKATGNTHIEYPTVSPRFCDCLVIDEGSLRSLAALPDETPSLELVTLQERRARIPLYCDAYVWLIDSQAVNRSSAVVAPDGPSKYNGLLKLRAEDLEIAWFERCGRSDRLAHTFYRQEFPEGSGEFWYALPEGF